MQFPTQWYEVKSETSHTQTESSSNQYSVDLFSVLRDSPKKSEENDNSNAYRGVAPLPFIQGELPIDYPHMSEEEYLTLWCVQLQKADATTQATMVAQLSDADRLRLITNLREDLHHTQVDGIRPLLHEQKSLENQKYILEYNDDVVKEYLPLWREFESLRSCISEGELSHTIQVTDMSRAGISPDRNTMIVNKTIDEWLSGHSRASDPEKWDRYSAIQDEMRNIIDERGSRKRWDLIYNILLASGVYIDSVTLAGEQTWGELLRKVSQRFSNMDVNKKAVLFPNDRVEKIEDLTSRIGDLAKKRSPFHKEYKAKSFVLRRLEGYQTKKVSQEGFPLAA